MVLVTGEHCSAILAGRAFQVPCSLMQVENFLMAQTQANHLAAPWQDHDDEDDDARLINFYALIFARRNPSSFDFVRLVCGQKKIMKRK